MRTPPCQVGSGPVGPSTRMGRPLHAAGGHGDEATPGSGEWLPGSATGVPVVPRRRGPRGGDLLAGGRAAQARAIVGGAPAGDPGGDAPRREGRASVFDVLRVRSRNLLVKVGQAHRSGGVRAAVRVAARMASRQLRRPLSHGAEYAFDRRHGVDTRGRRLVAAEVVARSEHGDAVPYEATSVLRLWRLLRSLPAIDPADFTFIDLGCGKGAALVVAAQRGFRRVVGVELDGDLARVARANARVVRQRTSTPVEVVEGDATAYRFPLEPSVVYLFNPFGLHTMRSVADSVVASLVERPRPLVVVYLNPVHRCVWDRTRALRATAGGRGWVVYSAVGPTGELLGEALGPPAPGTPSAGPDAVTRAGGPAPAVIRPGRPAEGLHGGIAQP